MSLINDALKRAQEAQRPTPSANANANAIRTVETSSQPNRFTSRLLVIGIFVLLSAAFAFIGLVMTGRLAHQNTALPPLAAAAPTPPASAESQPSPAPKAMAAATVTAAKSLPAPAPTPTPAPAAVVVAPVAAGSPQSSALLELPDSVHVQGIGYESSRSWAIVSGRTVYVGDLVKGVRVLQITRSTVTFGNNGQTNLLYVGQ